MYTLGGRHALDLVVRLAAVGGSLDHDALRGSREEGEHDDVEREELVSEGGHGVCAG